jgi:hypothetical protein
LAAAVSEGEREHGVGIASRGELGLPDGGQRGVGQELELPDGPDPDPPPVDARVTGKQGELVLDDREEAF